MTNERAGDARPGSETPDRRPAPSQTGPLAPSEPERAAAARARGLAAPHIEGGRDPDLERTRLEEHRYVRLLVAMVAVIVLAGFVLGILANLLTGQ